MIGKSEIPYENKVLVGSLGLTGGTGEDMFFCYSCGDDGRM